MLSEPQTKVQVEQQDHHTRDDRGVGPIPWSKVVIMQLRTLYAAGTESTRLQSVRELIAGAQGTNDHGDEVTLLIELLE